MTDDLEREVPEPGRHDRVAVVVVMYQSEPLMKGFVDSLKAGFAGVPFDLIAVDNASPDASADAVAMADPDATIVATGRNGGYAAGINAGAAAAGEFTALLVVNSDVRLSPGCVPELLDRLRQPQVGIAVPRLVDGSGVVIDSMRREPSVRRALAEALLGADFAGRHGLGEMVSNPTAYDVEQFTDWAEGSTQLISAECWKRCGEWDESFFLYSEETEFNLRARDLGFRTRYVPSAMAIHLEGGSGSSDSLWALQVINRTKLFGSRNGRLRSLAFWCATFLREVSRALLGHTRSRAAVAAMFNPSALRTRLVPPSEG